MTRNVLTPDALTMMDVIARTGSFAAAARELGKVPSALTYNVRQLEDALDVLLFDRRSGQAQLTAAGEELLHEGRRLLEQMDAVANRVKRVATGWETQLTVAVDDALSRLTVFELCEDFYALRPAVAVSSKPSPAGAAASGSDGPGTRLRLRTEVLAGTWEALVSGQADLAIGVGIDHAAPTGVQVETLGTMGFVFAVAPHHPLAAITESIGDALLVRHRAVAVADSAQRLTPLTVNLLPGQDVFTVPTMQAKLEAQLRSLGCGYLPEPIAREHIAAGRLVAKAVERARPPATFGYAWRVPAAAQAAVDAAAAGTAVAAAANGARRAAPVGLALRWWLDRLAHPATRLALLERHAGPWPAGY
ncbi:MAG: LysR family transcriptional regulator [Pseudomonadota bacterium]|nr:LysR family transcriptional regulator [Pseudomonadota bacterium]